MKFVDLGKHVNSGLCWVLTPEIKF